MTTNAINNIAKEMDVVFLTNMPDKYKDIRSEHLKNNGLGFELITNQGSKVEAVREITKNRKSKIGFIDDSPINLRQIKKGLSHVELFHFMKSNVFRKFTPDVHTHCSTGSWTVAKKIIKQILLG